MIKTIYNHILDMVFPRHCLNCKKSGVDLCEKCLTKLNPKTESTSFNLIVVFDYKDPIAKEIIHTCKYKKRKMLIKIMAKEMKERMLNELNQRNLEDKEHILIPIPMHIDKLLDRGFNQAELLAQEIAKEEMNIKIKTNCLIKFKKTIDQASIKNKTERKSNIKNVFKIKREKDIKNKRIIIIDDVATTGATFNEAKKMLKRAGVKDVKGLVFAH